MGALEKLRKSSGKMVACFLILHLLAGCIYILVVRPGHTQDAPYWVYRIGALAEEMRIHGVLDALPPHILSVTFNGYGYGAPLFYCDVFLWLPAVLVYLGMSEFTGYILLCASIWSVRAAVAFYSADLVLKGFQKMENRYVLSALFAFSYSFFPYMVELLLVRGAMGEGLASIFFPLVAAALYRITHEENRSPQNRILLALGLFGVVCSHTVSTVIVAYCVVFYVLYHWKAYWLNKWKIAEVVQAGVIAIGLSAFWLFPFMEQYFAHIIPDVGGWWSTTYLDVSDWFISYYHIKERETWVPSTFGILLIAWTFLFFIHRYTRRNKNIGMMLAMSWLLCIFMTSRTVMGIFEGPLGFMQFAWRLLSVVALLLSIVIVVIYYASSKKKAVVVAVYLLCALCLYLGDRAWHQYALTENTSVVYDPNNADGLYIPYNGFKGMHDARGEIVDTNLDVLQFEWERLPEAQFRLKYSNNTGNAVAQLPLLYYKGYKAYDLANQSELFIEKGDVGLIWLHLDPYELGDVVVSYVGTAIQKISNTVSCGMWIILAIYMLWRWRLHKAPGAGSWMA